MKKLFAFVLSIAIMSIQAFNINQLKPRTNVRPMKVSVIVPCVYRHFFWLSGLLESYENQTVKPDEVVISLSEVEKLNPKEINDLENGNWSFKLILIRHKAKIIDGENRTIAMDKSTGEILLFSDADDISHPQRVEISKFIIENYQVDHILHSLTHSRSQFKIYDLKNLTFLKFNTFTDVQRYASSNRVPITSGSPCFTRKIAAALKWHGTADVQYAHNVYSRFPDRIVLPIPLILYRVHLSSHSPARNLQNLLGLT